MIQRLLLIVVKRFSVEIIFNIIIQLLEYIAPKTKTSLDDTLLKYAKQLKAYLDIYENSKNKTKN